MPDSYLFALAALGLYATAFVTLRHTTRVGWFTLEVGLGGLLGTAGIAIGAKAAGNFNPLYFASLYGMGWFCWFFVSAIFYASISVSIIRHLFTANQRRSTLLQIYHDCIEAPFAERSAMLLATGQSQQLVDSDTTGQNSSRSRYRISPSGMRTAATIRRVRRIFGFRSTGYYSVPGARARTTDVKLSSCAFSAVVGTCAAVKFAQHGVALPDLPWLGRGLLVVGLAALFAFLYYQILSHLLRPTETDPSRWILWAPLSFTLFAYELASVVLFGWGGITDKCVFFGIGFVAFHGVKKTPIRFLWPLFALLLIGSVPYYFDQGPGFIHNEMVERYFPVYLSKRDLLHILFDPVLEFGDNRSRPLSLFFDFIDYRMCQAAVTLGHPRFIMYSYPAFVLASTGTAYCFFLRELKLPPFIALLLIALFLTSPAIYLAVLYRSAKPGAALMSIIVFAMAYRLVERAEAAPYLRVSRWRLIGLWFACLMLPMFDELGTYSLAMLSTCLFAYTLFCPSGASVRLLLTTAASLAAAYAYRYGISANLYALLNGTPIDNPFNMGDTLNGRMDFKDLLNKAETLTLDTFRFVYGNVTSGMACAILVLLIVAYAVQFRVRPYRRNWSWGRAVPAAILAGTLLMVLVQFAVMVHYHPRLMEPDVRRVYYPLPTAALALMLVALALKAVGQSRDLTRAAAVALGLCIVGNLEAMPSHHAVFHTNHLKPGFEDAELTVAQIEQVRAGTLAPSSARRVVGLLLRK